MKRMDTAGNLAFLRYVAFTPKGGCPLKHHGLGVLPRLIPPVAFTPKGGCPLKRSEASTSTCGSVVAFTPKGGCPLKQLAAVDTGRPHIDVAFTPKGGCPLKPDDGVQVRRVGER